MKRSNYFNYTRPSQTQLNNTEESKAQAIQRRTDSLAQMGIVSGFRVSVNSSDNTKIDISPGVGYTGGLYLQEDYSGEGSGERISTISESASGGTTISSVGLADYTLGALNYVTLVYTEIESSPLAEKYYPYTVRNTLVAESYLTTVYTEAEWASLPAADLKNLILIAIVTANGAGSALTSASISQVVQPKTHPTVNRTTNMAGVTVEGLSPETYIGIGTIRYDPTTYKMYYTAPSDVEGTGVQISSSGQYTIYSATLSYWITLDIVYASLPTSAESVSITVYSLYGRAIPRFSAEDTIHRDLVGSGVPNATNPHGLTIDDIEGGTLEHADFYHLNGISIDADSDFLEPSIYEPGGIDQVRVYNKAGVKNNFLVDGISYGGLTGVNENDYGIVSFDSLPLPDSGVYLIYVDSAGEVGSVRIGEELTNLANIRIVEMSNQTAGNATLAWDATVRTLTYTAPGDVAGDPVYPMSFGSGATIQGYYKIYSNNGIDWIIVYCDGDPGATNSDTFSVGMNSSEQSLESIVPIGSVIWDQATEDLSEIFDIRNFTTSDIRDNFLEEHDRNGFHTKVLRNQLRIHAPESGIFCQASSYGINGSASVAYGVVGNAGTNYGVLGNAVNSYGVYGQASIYGVFGRATSNAVQGYASAIYGVYGFALSSYGLYGEAGLLGVHGKYGVYGKAQSYAIVGSAVDSYGVQGLASGDTGVMGSASNWYGVFGKASTFGVFGSALDSHGVYGEAQTYGVFGTATIETAILGVAPKMGVFGQATSYGVYGKGVDSIGVFGSGGIIGVQGYAAGDTAIYGEAVGDTGVYAEAVNTGVYGKVTGNYGVYGEASSYGVYGIVTGLYGVFGIASNYGVRGNATAADGTGLFGYASSLGAYGIAIANSGSGVVGICSSAGGSGVAGFGAHYGVYGEGLEASGIGVLGGGSSAGVWGAGYDGGYGVYCYGILGYVPTPGTAGTFNPANANLSFPLEIDGVIVWVNGSHV